MNDMPELFDTDALEKMAQRHAEISDDIHQEVMKGARKLGDELGRQHPEGLDQQKVLDFCEEHDIDEAIIGGMTSVAFLASIVLKAQEEEQAIVVGEEDGFRRDMANLNRAMKEITHLLTVHRFNKEERCQ